MAEGRYTSQRMPRLSACRGSATECAGVTAPIISESSGVLMLLRELLELLALRQVRPPAAATIALAAA